MAVTTFDQRPQLSPEVLAVLDSLRARIRLYVWAEGIATGLAWLGLAFWMTLAIDWAFEPEVPARKLMLAAVIGVFGVLFVRLVLQRALVRINRSNLATVLERRFPFLDDSLLTAVLLTSREIDPEKCNLEMLARTCWEANERIGKVKLGEVFNYAPLRRAIVGAVVLGLSVAAFARAAPEAMDVWVKRVLYFDDHPWPRKTSLQMGGQFANANLVKVARGADVTVVVLADASKRVPDVVELRYRTEGGARERKAMDREGSPTEEMPFQQFTYTFQGILTSIDFEIVGGDDRLPKLRSDPKLRIQVVDNPTVEMVLHPKYPSYMPRTPIPLPVTGAMNIPYGTQLTVEAKSNKPLQSVHVDVISGNKTLPTQVLGPEALAEDSMGFRCALEPLYSDVTLLFTLHDTDGVRSTEPVRLVLVAAMDEAPQLAVQLDGIDRAITAQARVPFVGQVSDDYGIGRVWAEVSVDQKLQSPVTLAEPATRPASFTLRDVAVEIADFELKPGQKVLLTVKASDLYDLGTAPNVGNSERWLLEVVTPEQLRAMLEARELVLRQRFERIIEEVVETRGILEKVSFRSPSAGTGDDSPSAAVKAESGFEPGDKPTEEPEKLSPADRAASRQVRAQQALQNSRKNAVETKGVAESFDDIRKQLVNNRLDTEELKMRLETRIAKPLHDIADRLFPELDRRLERLHEAAGDMEYGPRERNRAIEQVDEILLAMKQVLSQMLELEDYNQLVETLRTIIKLQESIEELTKTRRKQTIRDLQEE